MAESFRSLRSGSVSLETGWKWTEKPSTGADLGCTRMTRSPLLCGTPPRQRLLPWMMSTPSCWTGLRQTCCTWAPLLPHLTRPSLWWVTKEMPSSGPSHHQVGCRSRFLRFLSTRCLVRQPGSSSWLRSLLLNSLFELLFLIDLLSSSFHTIKFWLCDSCDFGLNSTNTRRHRDQSEHLIMILLYFKKCTTTRTDYVIGRMQQYRFNYSTLAFQGVID